MRRDEILKMLRENCGATVCRSLIGQDFGQPQSSAENFKVCRMLLLERAVNLFALGSSIELHYDNELSSPMTRTVNIAA